MEQDLRVLGKDRLGRGIDGWDKGKGFERTTGNGFGPILSELLPDSFFFILTSSNYMIRFQATRNKVD